MLFLDIAIGGLKVNYLQLLSMRNVKQDELDSIKSKMRGFGYEYIEEAEKKIDLEWLGPKQWADALVEQLNERDFPYTRDHIKQIFDFSGYQYTDEHIEAARPDSQESVDEEERRYRD